jgi:hypothetical protein
MSTEPDHHGEISDIRHSDPRDKDQDYLFFPFFLLLPIAVYCII